MQINRLAESDVTMHRRKYDVGVWIISSFFFGWIVSARYYHTEKIPGLQEAARWTGYTSSQVSLKELTNQLGACQSQLAATGLRFDPNTPE